MKITYVGHSGFFVELAHTVLLFDYWEGDLPAIPADKRLYILVSHRHGDHFNPEIFRLCSPGREVFYLLSDDIGAHRIPEEAAGCTVRLGPCARWHDDRIQVETLRSTDEGVAFWVECEGKKLYHAGDLNDWQWPGEDPAWNRRMAADFRRDLEPLRGRKMDAAFLPLDPRQGEEAAAGLDYFLTVADARAIYPMHCWEDYTVIDRWLREHPHSPFRSRIIHITRRGECFKQ